MIIFYFRYIRTKKHIGCAAMALAIAIMALPIQARAAAKSIFGWSDTQTEKQDSSAQLTFNDLIAAQRVPRQISDVSEVESAAEYASGKTGVRKDFLMGMLVVESNLGRNTGKCTYGQVRLDAQRSHQRGQLSARAWRTFGERSRIITTLADELRYDADQLSVSCNPGVYAGTGGAMGPAQFMPDTWMEYRDRIAEVVQDENPDPWNIEHAAVAMALKLSDVPGVTEHNALAERNAAKMYLSGNTSGKYDWYANQIVYWSKNYRALFG